MIWKTAWKNVWRNKVRSLVVISSVTIGIFAGVFCVGLMNGLITQRIGDSLNEEISHIQITCREFRNNNDPGLLIGDPQKCLAQMRSIDGISGFSTRILITGMANSAYKSSGVQITGINPEKEKEIFRINSKIIPGSGNYFEMGSKYNLALVGEDLAKDLKIIRYYLDTAAISRLRSKGVPGDIAVKLGRLSFDRFANEKQFIKKMHLLLRAGEAKKFGALIKKEAWHFNPDSRLTLNFLDNDNNQVSAVFRITGLYRISDSMFEKANVFVRNSDLRKLAGIPEGSFHQIIIKIGNIDQTEIITRKLSDRLPTLEVLNWKKLQPELAMMTDLVSQFYLIFGLIILAALAFGIINTMLMVVLERTREIGMLTAIGMNKRRVFTMIMLESVYLSITGGIAGMLLSYFVIRITSGTGINLSQYAEGFEALGYSAVIYPSIGAGFFVIVTILIILTGVISSVYPALKALKLNPVEAIRSE